MVRLAASLQAAKAAGSISSSVSPFLRRALSSSVLARSSASLSFCNSGSSEFVSSTIGSRRFSTFSLESTRLPSHLSIVFLIEHGAYGEAGVNAAYGFAEKRGDRQDGDFVQLLFFCGR